MKRNINHLHRHGVTSILAMLYMILFATLAVGFVAMVGTSTQVASNEQNASRAFLAAESGLSFARYHLGLLKIPSNATAGTITDAVYNQLGTRLNGTVNLGGESIGRDGDLIRIPDSTSDFIKVDADGNGFQLAIQRNGTDLRVVSTGRGRDGAVIQRAIQLDFQMGSGRSNIFDYGIASRSPIIMTGNTRVRGLGDPAAGKVLSTSARTPTLDMTGNNTITGDIYFSDPEATVDLGGNSNIAGSTNPTVWAEHIHTNVDPPDFPTVDTSVFEPFATNNITNANISGNKTLSNIRIKANANTSFSGNIKLRGVVYIEAPNKISFTGNLDVQGVIVVQNNPPGDWNSNYIDFGGNVSFQGVETLPASYGTLRELTGSAFLAPNFALKMRGNFGTIGGTIVASQSEFTGNAGGTIRGSLINLEDSTVTTTGNTDLAFDPEGANTNPAGLRFSGRYVPIPDSYSEVQP